MGWNPGGDITGSWSSPLGTPNKCWLFMMWGIAGRPRPANPGNGEEVGPSPSPFSTGTPHAGTKGAALDIPGMVGIEGMLSKDGIDGMLKPAAASREVTIPVSRLVKEVSSSSFFLMRSEASFSASNSSVLPRHFL